MFFRWLRGLLARAAPLKRDNEENQCGVGMEVTLILCSSRPGDLDPIAADSLWISESSYF